MPKIVYMEPLESIATLFNNPKAMDVLYMASNFAVGLSVLHMYRKYMNGVAAGLVAYCLFPDNHPGIGLREFLRREYHLNLEEVSGIKPPQDVLAAEFRG